MQETVQPAMAVKSAAGHLAPEKENLKAERVVNHLAPEKENLKAERVVIRRDPESRSRRRTKCG